jgi:hypothetical protein
MPQRPRAIGRIAAFGLGALVLLGAAWLVWRTVRAPEPPRWEDVVARALQDAGARGARRPSRVVLVGTGWEDARVCSGVEPDHVLDLNHLPDPGLIGSPPVLVLVLRAELGAFHGGDGWSGEPVPVAGGRGEWVLVEMAQGIP